MPKRAIAYAPFVNDYYSWLFTQTSPFGKRIDQAALLANELVTSLSVYDPNTVVGSVARSPPWSQTKPSASLTRPSSGWGDRGRPCRSARERWS